MSEEYIRKQEMLDAVDHLHIIPSIDGTGRPTPTEDFRVQFLGTVLKVETADVAPVRHARWVNGCCKRCGEHALYWSMSSTYHESDFCPFCGAKMDEGQKHG